MTDKTQERISLFPVEKLAEIGSIQYLLALFQNGQIHEMLHLRSSCSCDLY